MAAEPPGATTGQAARASRLTGGVPGPQHIWLTPTQLGAIGTPPDACPTAKPGPRTNTRALAVVLPADVDAGDRACPRHPAPWLLPTAPGYSGSLSGSN